jgi:hypothetical protein
MNYEKAFDPSARRVVNDGTIVTCEACGLKQTFKPRELGTLWLWVESWDGDSSDPVHGAALCSPACVVRLFNDPAKVGTLADAFTLSGEKGRKT